MPCTRNLRVLGAGLSDTEFKEIRAEAADLDGNLLEARRLVALAFQGNSEQI